MTDNGKLEGEIPHDEYRYTTIDYWHPDPGLRIPRLVSVNFYTGETQRVSGVDIEVGR